MTSAEPLTVPDEDGIHTIVPEEAYHQDRDSLSVSGAKLLLPPSCPSKFREYMDNERKPKKEWDFGHVAHRLLLGKGANFQVLDPDIHGLKKDGTVAESPTATAGWKTAVADARSRGRIPIHIDDYIKADAMVRKVLDHPLAGPLFTNGGTPEVSLYHTDPETGLRLRGRCDWIDNAGDIVDYKTSVTANPAELERIFYRLGYFMQAAWYIDLAIAVGASENPEFRFVVQEKLSPFEVTVVRYDQEAINEGRARNREAIDIYTRCLKASEWPGYGDELHTISLPAWAVDTELVI